jgi:hypothetical protein
MSPVSVQTRLPCPEVHADPRLTPTSCVGAHPIPAARDDVALQRDPTRDGATTATLAGHVHRTDVHADSVGDAHEGDRTMPHTKRTQSKTISTTVGELAAAFYEAALAELKNEALAAKVAQQMVRDVLRQRQFA